MVSGYYVNEAVRKMYGIPLSQLTPEQREILRQDGIRRAKIINERQKDFLNILKNKDKEICFGIGSPGTGKSYISLSYALKELKEGNYDNIIMIVHRDASTIVPHSIKSIA